jgi:hypothetical protein
MLVERLVGEAAGGGGATDIDGLSDAITNSIWSEQLDLVQVPWLMMMAVQETTPHWDITR